MTGSCKEGSFLQKADRGLQ